MVWKIGMREEELTRLEPLLDFLFSLFVFLTAILILIFFIIGWFTTCFQRRRKTRSLLWTTLVFINARIWSRPLIELDILLNFFQFTVPISILLKKNGLKLNLFASVKDVLLMNFFLMFKVLSFYFELAIRDCPGNEMADGSKMSPLWFLSYKQTGTWWRMTLLSTLPL